MIKFIRNIRKYIFLQILFDLIGVFCLAVTPLLQKYFFDYALNSETEVIIKIVVLYIFLHLIYVVSQYFCMIFAFKGEVKFEKNLKKNFFDSLFLRKDYEFRKNEIGDYISFQANDIVALEQDYLQPIIDIIKSINMFLVYSLVLFIGIDWRIGIVIICTSFLSIIIPKVLGGKLKRIRDLYQNQLSKYVVKITDILEGFTLINGKTIKNIEKRHDDELQKVASKRYIFGKNKSLNLSVGLFFTKMVKVISFIAIIILFYKKQITIGTGIATLSFVSVLLEPINSIIYDMTTIQAVKKIKDKFIEFIEYKPVKLEKIEILRYNICLRNIEFKCENFELKKINFTFNKGCKYLITGDSGSGKSTLLKLIAGRLKASSGYIEIDGKNMNKYDYSDLISYLEQKEHIFNEGIIENITVYNSYDYNHKKYENISRKISDIYQSNIKNSEKMSGGEKQVISLLRMFARASDVLLMDEPFSAIDYELREKFIDYLFTDNEFRDKIIILISHHMNDEKLKYFDCRINMKNGEIKEVEILKNNEL